MLQSRPAHSEDTWEDDGRLPPDPAYAPNAGSMVSAKLLAAVAGCRLEDSGVDLQFRGMTVRLSWLPEHLVRLDVGVFENGEEVWASCPVLPSLKELYIPEYEVALPPNFSTLFPALETADISLCNVTAERVTELVADIAKISTLKRVTLRANFVPEFMGPVGCEVVLAIDHPPGLVLNVPLGMKKHLVSMECCVWAVGAGRQVVDVDLGCLAGCDVLQRVRVNVYNHTPVLVVVDGLGRLPASCGSVLLTPFVPGNLPFVRPCPGWQPNAVPGGHCVALRRDTL